jgi:hypothetical protein
VIAAQQAAAGKNIGMSSFARERTKPSTWSAVVGEDVYLGFSLRTNTVEESSLAELIKVR